MSQGLPSDETPKDKGTKRKRKVNKKLFNEDFDCEDAEEGEKGMMYLCMYCEQANRPTGSNGSSQKKSAFMPSYWLQ